MIWYRSGIDSSRNIDGVPQLHYVYNSSLFQCVQILMKSRHKCLKTLAAFRFTFKMKR